MRLEKTSSLLILAFSLVAQSWAQQYTVSPLGSFATSDELDALGGVNAFGQVAGEFTNTAGQFHAFLYDTSLGGIVDLGTLGGKFSRANGINNSGTVVGQATIANDSPHAFLYTASGGMRDLNSVVSFGGKQSSALAINDAGGIVGWFLTSSGAQHAFFYNPTTSSTTDIQALLPFGGASSAAYGINSSNQIVGIADVGGGVDHAFYYDMNTQQATDYGTLGGTTSVALAIDSSGLIVGSSDLDSSSFHAGQAQIGLTGSDLGTLGGQTSSANSVNDSGHIVGGAQISNGNTDAFLWDSTNGMRDLNTLLPADSGWTLVEAQGISRSGLIVGYGIDPSHLQQLFMLTPQLSLLPASDVSITASGLAYSRVTKTFNGTVEINNIGGEPVNGPFQVVFAGLPAGVTLSNAVGKYQGAPYLTISSASLMPGQSASVSVQLSNPSNVTINATPAIYAGSLN